MALLSFLVTSCNNKRANRKDMLPFTRFISGLDHVKLPFHYNLVTQDIKNYKKPSFVDTLFMMSQDYIIGLLPDTLHSYKILYLSTGDDFYPSVKVFSKEGKTLSNNLICFPECAAGDPDMDSCSSSVDIYGDSIFATIRYMTCALGNSSDNLCDSFNEIRTSKTFIFNKSGDLTIRESILLH